jgi:hypothetical protein
MNSTQAIKTIESSIDCNLMDVKNISKMIESFTELSILQKAYKHFCHCKSIFDESDYNENKIIESIIEYNVKDENLLKAAYTTPQDFIMHLGFYIDDEEKGKEYKNLLFVIANKLLESIDFKFFNASLLLSLNISFIPGVIDDVVDQEKLSLEFDGFDVDNNDHYFHALKNGRNISLARLCIIKALYQDDEDVAKNSIMKLQDMMSHYYNDQVPEEMYERIWNRAIELDLEISGEY